jgi:hypothetical protein
VLRVDPTNSLRGGSAPRENHYLLSMLDVLSVEPNAMPARGHVPGHRLMSNPLKYKGHS